MTFLFQGDQQLMFWLETEVLIVDYISWVYEYLRKKTKKKKPKKKTQKKVPFSTPVPSINFVLIIDLMKIEEMIIKSDQWRPECCM